jgi:hypothetical protein
MPHASCGGAKFVAAPGPAQPACCLSPSPSQACSRLPSAGGLPRSVHSLAFLSLAPALACLPARLPAFQPHNPAFPPPPIPTLPARPGARSCAPPSPPARPRCAPAVASSPRPASSRRAGRGAHVCTDSPCLWLPRSRMLSLGCRPCATPSPHHPATHQVAPSLDKTGVFCRQALDCAAVVAALAPVPPAAAAAAAAPPLAGPPSAGARLAAVPFSSAEAFRAALGVRLAGTRVGFLPGTSRALVDALRAVPGLEVAGPLPLPPGGRRAWEAGRCGRRLTCESGTGGQQFPSMCAPPFPIPLPMQASTSPRTS